MNSPRNYFLDCSNNSYKESLYNYGTNPYKKSEYMFQPIVNSLCLADDNLKLSGFDFDKNSQKFIISKGAHQAEVIAEQTKKPELKATLDDKIEKTLATCFKELPDKISFTWNRVSFTADEISTNPLTYTVVNLLRKKNESPYLVVNCESMSVTNKSGLSLKNDTTIDGLAYAGCKEISESLSDKVAVTNIKCDSTSNNYIATNTTSKPLPEIKPTKDIKYKPLQASNSIEGYSTLKSENEPKKFLDSRTFQKDGYADWNAQIAKSKNTGSSKFNDYEELKCAELGFKPKTIKYYDCIIKLKSKPSLEVAQTQTIQIATQRPIGDGSNEDTICQKYGFRVGDESYKNCRLELKIAQDRADDQLRQYELQKQAYEQQVRQYEEQDRIRRAAITAAEEEKQRQNNIKLLTFGLGLASGRTFSEAAPALNGQAMYPRGYFNPPPLPPAEPVFNNVRLITPSGSANCQYSATWRELRCN